MRFLHASSGPRIEKDSFKAPNLKDSVFPEFNLPGAFYLSKADEDDSSMWLKFREKMKKYPVPKTTFLSRGGKKKTTVEVETNSEEYLDEDPWIGQNKHFYDVDFEKHKIYTVDSIEDVHNLFTKYGEYSSRIFVDDSRIDENGKFLLGQLRKLETLEKFIENLDECYKLKMMDEKIDILKSRRSFLNLPVLKIKGSNVIIPKKKISTNFLVDLIRTKEYLKSSIEKYITIEKLRESTKIQLDKLNFIKLKKDGYNGIYYTTNLIQFLPESEFVEIYSEKMKKHENKEHHEIDTLDLMKKIDIGTLPKIHPDMKDKNSLDAKWEIQYYLKWLGSDTLILWDWIF